MAQHDFLIRSLEKVAGDAEDENGGWKILRQKSNRRDEVGVTEVLVRARGSEQMGPRMGENNKLGIGGRENTGLDTHFGTEEEEGT
jgi:hypothetical protein